MKTTKILPPRFFQLALLTLALIHFLFPIYFLYETSMRFLGMVPILTGIWLNLKADSLFKQHRTTIKPFEESSALIESGPFLFSRNPIYLGLVLIVLGLAVVSGSIISFIVPAALSVILNYFYILPEEKQLMEGFGKDYQLYCMEVPRWIIFGRSRPATR